MTSRAAASHLPACNESTAIMTVANSIHQRDDPALIAAGFSRGF